MGNMVDQIDEQPNVLWEFAKFKAASPVITTWAGLAVLHWKQCLKGDVQVTKPTNKETNAVCAHEVKGITVDFSKDFGLSVRYQLPHIGKHFEGKNVYIFIIYIMIYIYISILNASGMKRQSSLSIDLRQFYNGDGTILMHRVRVKRTHRWATS